MGMKDIRRDDEPNVLQGGTQDSRRRGCCPAYDDKSLGYDKSRIEAGKGLDASDEEVFFPIQRQ